jgi:uncharacterized tellurite resistance protein B-like protein
MTATASRLSLEIIKLLLQVAWADDRMTEDEKAHIWRVAGAAGIGEDDAAELQACLEGTRPLPAPDFGFLRAHRDAALQAAHDMVTMDHEVARGEVLVLEQIRELLGG